MSLLNKLIDLIRTITGMSESMESRLDAEAAKASERLDWRHSIVDLMKLVHMDSSLEARKELAQELGYTGPLDGSAEMNNFLHGRVMEHLR